MALPLYAFTLFVSAFILFLVQPIVGKIILPKLGGTPQVWNTCMMFFQTMLLIGYAYTHTSSTRLTLRQQLIAHALLLLIPLCVLLPFPFALGGIGTEDQINPHSLWGFVPNLGSNPIVATLSVLFLYVGLPFVVVSTTAPLLQKWFVYTGHPASKDPYFLYGASNLGSALSLIAYPLLIEPYVSLRHQGWLFGAGYVSVLLLVMVSGLMVFGAKEATAKPKPAHAPTPEPTPPQSAAAAETGITASAPAAAPAASTAMKSGQPPKSARPGGKAHGAADHSIALASDEMTFGRRFRWVMLAAIPSSLMLGITTHITTDLSPQPMFWLVPLFLYLVSFILVFMRWPIVWLDKAHIIVVYLQPFLIAAMIISDVLHLSADTGALPFAIGCHVFGFFATALVCHGELAKDRPSTRHLTEFYLLMSIGGALGGIFNALIAPVVFKWGIWEFPLALFGAGLARPQMFDTGVLDNFLASLFEGQPDQSPATKGHKAGKHTPIHSGSVTANESLVRTLDIIWPVGILVLTAVLGVFLDGRGATRVQRFIVYGIPLGLCCACMTRNIRIGFGIGAVLLVISTVEYVNDSSTTRYRDRGYFGAFAVKEYTTERKIDGDKRAAFTYRQLIHGHIDHGMNFLIPAKADRGNPSKDLSRLATTYYHREGPVGRVMEKFNWFPDRPNANTYWADTKMPTALVGASIADIGIGGLPTTALVAAWSEPPIATIGLGTGTMASYGRPYQHVHFYEIDNLIRRLSLSMPTRQIHTFKQYHKDRDPRKETWFNYLEQAIERGSTVQVLMGDARLRMNLPYKNHYEDPNGPDDGGGPNNFYHMMVVDAFSSDAIPAHLLTVEAFKMYFDRLAPEGVLCVHTSNRFVDLPKVVAAVTDKLGYVYLRGHDADTDRDEGHYTSEWVMVARKSDHLKHLSGDTKFLEAYNDRTKKKKAANEQYWQLVNSDSRYVWTDDYYNLLSVVRFGRSRDDD